MVSVSFCARRNPTPGTARGASSSAGDEAFSLVPCLGLLRTIAILERMLLLRVAKEALVEAARIARVARLSVPTTHEAVVGGLQALVTEDVTPVDEVGLALFFSALAAVQAQELAEDQAHQEGAKHVDTKSPAAILVETRTKVGICAFLAF